MDGLIVHTPMNRDNSLLLNYRFVLYRVFLAGLAFDPLDGLLNAIPHMFAPFLLPMHFRTNIALLFLEGVWTAYIHSNVHNNIWPVMGVGYHTIHHTTYKHNYGHYTVFMDLLFGTIREPEDIFKKDWVVQP